ncbi:helix-turn-helix transcriptional regulator [Senegalia massiliensis]|uniref:helix-turn-helix transcriptional regulator n=1 Tax=Senegalia massiliensis TaxID=1720316 RepID=UPI0010303FD1|nr:PAS domain-containing protein [Senegalia massiliensis]
MTNTNIHPLLSNMVPLVEGISKTLGSNCEVVLHDLNNPTHSVIAISNGHVTGREIGSPMTEKGLKAIKNQEFEKNLIKYKTITNDGRTLKSSTLFIKDESNNVVGCLCINVDISEFIVAKKVISELTQTIDEKEGNIQEVSENYFKNVNDILYSLVKEVLENKSKPVSYLSRDEKIEIVNELEQKGIFLIKGSVEYLADKLCVSIYTIYNYLDEIRKQK